MKTRAAGTAVDAGQGAAVAGARTGAGAGARGAAAARRLVAAPRPEPAARKYALDEINEGYQALMDGKNVRRAVATPIGRRAWKDQKERSEK